MFRKAAALILILSLVLAGGLPGALALEYYSASTPLNHPGDAKLHNIRLAVEAIDGAEVPTGGRFSFNATVGPRVSGRGYRTAPNGRGVPVTGGGVAQAATTLYLALLKAGEDIEIDPVKTYGPRFTDDYVQDPERAVVTDYDAGIDLSFTNYGEDMSIDMWVADDNVCCAISLGGQAAFSFIENVEPEGDDEDDEYVEWSMGAAPEGRGLLGSAEVDCGDDDDVLNNVRLAADCVNDVVLESGDTFSFNDVVGPRTARYGYRRAVNGRGARVTGGGVAQVASALWLAIKDAEGFSIVEKSTYGDSYNQDYVDSSYDAILTDYASGRDFCFRYTGAGSVTIYAYESDGWLYCDIYTN